MEDRNDDSLILMVSVTPTTSARAGDERGQGYNGIEDGAIYEKGKRLEADKDERS